MNKLLSELKENNFKVTNISYLNNKIIITSNNKKYLLINKKDYREDIINYLNSINCKYYLPKYIEINNYQILEYYDSNNSLKDLVLTLSDIHLKSQNNILYSDQELKGIYEEKCLEIDKLMKYYLGLQDYIEELFYTRCDYYEMIINISKIYHILRTSRHYLDKWYELKDNTYREVLLINNFSLTNFISNKKKYFIDFKNSSRDNIINDLELLYKSITDDNIYYLFDLYNTNIKLTESEIYLFFSSICKIDMFKFNSNLDTNLVLIKDYFTYIDKTLSFVLEKDKEYQESNKNIFKEEDDDIKFSSNKNKD